MKTSKNLKFQIPELDDQANITVIGSALEALDDAAGDALAMNGDASSAQVTFTRADSRSNIESGSTFATIFAKISRYFADLKDAAFSSIANNDTTTSSGYVADARIVKTHGDEIDKVTNQLGTYYFGTTTDGKPGYKTSANGTYSPFRKPVGTATAGDVLTGKTFANADSDNVTGTMPNNGDLSKTLTPTGDNTVTYTIPAGYTSGGTITADGSTAYAAGYKSATPDTFDIVISDLPSAIHTSEGYGYTTGSVAFPRLDYVYATVLSTDYRNDETTINSAVMTTNQKYNITNLDTLTIGWKGGYNCGCTVRLSKV